LKLKRLFDRVWFAYMMARFGGHSRLWALRWAIEAARYGE
jgi:hypothetical protein